MKNLIKVQWESGLHKKINRRGIIEQTVSGFTSEKTKTKRTKGKEKFVLNRFMGYGKRKIRSRGMSKLFD